MVIATVLEASVEETREYSIFPSASNQMSLGNGDKIFKCEKKPPKAKMSIYGLQRQQIE